MALRDQPYLPLFVQDFLTDEKLMECSASATGVYIRIMCVMHKSETYGKILLKQKDKQSTNQIENFALKLVRHMPYDLVTISCSITELCNEKCLEIEGDYLVQGRMVRDGLLSIKRSKSGSKGGKTTQGIAREFAKAKPQANAEIEIEIEIEDKIEEEDVFNTGGMGDSLKTENQKKNNMSTAKDTEGIPLPFKSPAFASIWSEWLQYRKEARIKNYTPTGLKRLFGWLTETSGGDEKIAIQIVEQSLTKGWQGLFELKTLPNATNITNTTTGSKAGSLSRERIQAAKDF